MINQPMPGTRLDSQPDATRFINAKVPSNDIYLYSLFRDIHHVFATMLGHRYLMVRVTTTTVEDCEIRPWDCLSMYPGRQTAKR